MAKDWLTLLKAPAIDVLADRIITDIDKHPAKNTDIAQLIGRVGFEISLNFEELTAASDYLERHYELPAGAVDLGQFKAPVEAGGISVDFVAYAINRPTRQ